MQTDIEEIQNLSIKYKEQLKSISQTSKNIELKLREHYTYEYVKAFPSFDELLEDVNYICEGGGIGKLIFIKEIETLYKNIL